MRISPYPHLRIKTALQDLQSLLSDLTSGDDDRAEGVVPALTQYGESALKALFKLLDDESADKRWWAVRALAAIGKPAILALTQALQSANSSVRVEAARTLAMMEIPETIPILFDASGDPSTMVQHWTEQGLNKLGVGMVFFEP